MKILRPSIRRKAEEFMCEHQARVSPSDIADMNDHQLIESIVVELLAKMCDADDFDPEDTVAALRSRQAKLCAGRAVREMMYAMELLEGNR